MEFITYLSELSCWPYLIPPVAGAIIGYFTNYLAIRMLFRPLTKKYFLKIPLPLTPGIIPARRRELARRIGDMVGDHILTREVILEKLQSPAVDDALYRWVAERFNAIISQDLGPGLSLLPDKSRALWQSWWGRGWRQAYLVVNYVVEHSDLQLFLNTPIAEFSRRLLGSDINSLVPEDLRGEFSRKLPQLLHEGLQSSSLSVWLGDEIDRVTQRFVTSERSLGEILPAELQTALMQEIHRELPDLLTRFSRLLYDPEIRAGLKKRLHQGINVYIENMGFWRRLLTSWAMSDEEIKEKIDKLVDDVAQDFAASLKQPLWQEKVFDLLAERVAAFLEMSPAMLAGRLSFVRVNRGLELLKSGLLKQVKSEALSNRLARMLEEFAGPLLSKPLSAVLDDFGISGAETRLTAGISERILRTLRSNQVKRRLAVVAASRFDQWFAGYPLGRLSRFLPATLHEPIIDLLYQMARRRLVEELPRLSERFEIKGVVEERVNQLPIIQVEELLLSVMREHFTYINVFGALVGFLIGGVQVLLFWGLGR
jgi:uncharacterized membrane protein YheB (UPF0754 family)